MKFTRFSKVGMAALGVILLAWLILTLAFGGDNPSPQPLVTDDKHCPNCGRELPFGITAKDCPFCAIERRQDARRGNAASGGHRINPTFPIVAGSLFVILLAANVFVALRNRKVQEKDETYFHLQCPKCSRKIRFRQNQFGKAALCPLCKRPIVFPRLQMAQSPWMKMKRWLRLAPQ
jgi:hypothetical protein